jgi:DNA-directed RNA polymerase subunit RPC12/RpoP
MTAHQKATVQTTMMSRSTQSSVTGRASAMRRLRRRASAASQFYCATNGCTSYLELDAESRVARCPICGFVRRTN